MISRLGKLYLSFKFKEDAKIQAELNRKYEGEYRNVGKMLMADIFMALAVVFFVSLFAILLYLLIG